MDLPFSYIDSVNTDLSEDASGNVLIHPRKYLNRKEERLILLVCEIQGFAKGVELCLFCDLIGWL